MIKDPPQKPRRILISRIGAMGDVVHAMPAVAALRKALPEVQIGWAIEARWSELLSAPGTNLSGPVTPQRPLVDFVHTVDTRNWRISVTSMSTWREVREALGGVRSAQYDTALDVQGAIKSSLLAKLSNAPTRVGSATPREGPARLFYTQAISTESAHVIDQAVELASAMCGEKLSNQPVTLPIHDESERWADDIVQHHGRFAILNPGAGWGAKIWPTERYAEVATALGRRGYASLINFGPGEQEIADAVAQASGGSAIPCTCSISQMISLGRRAALMIGGDTGPMHVCAALNVPVVALFGPTDPARTGPYGTRSRVLRSPESVTNSSHVAEADPGLVSIAAEEVTAAALELLSQ